MSVKEHVISIVVGVVVGAVGAVGGLIAGVTIVEVLDIGSLGVLVFVGIGIGAAAAGAFWGARVLGKNLKGWSFLGGIFAGVSYGLYGLFFLLGAAGI